MTASEIWPWWRGPRTGSGFREQVARSPGDVHLDDRRGGRAGRRAAYAASMAKQGHFPDVVFAIDTFVSSDSTTGDATLCGCCDRDRDSWCARSTIPTSIRQPMSHASSGWRTIMIFAVQWGATGGGNDGAAFTRYGAVDVALGWPAVYSHSPVETSSIKDVDALSRITEALATEW